MKIFVFKLSPKKIKDKQKGSQINTDFLTK